jgi:hypothetical protein
MRNCREWHKHQKGTDYVGGNTVRFNEYVTYLTFIQEEYIGCTARYIGIMEGIKLGYRLQNMRTGNAQSHVDKVRLI